MKKAIEILTLAFVLLLLNGCEGEKIEKPDQGSDNVPENPIPEGGEEDDSTPEDDRQTQTKGPVTLTLGKVTATTASFESVLDIETIDDYQEVGFIYSTISEMDVESKTVTKVQITQEAYADTFTDLSYNTRYYYTIYLVRHNGICQYGETQTFTTDDITISVDDVAVTLTTATFTGKVVRDAQAARVKVGIAYGTSDTSNSNLTRVEVTPDTDGNYTLLIEELNWGAEYLFKTYVCQNGYIYGSSQTFTTLKHPYQLSYDLNVASATDLSSSASANCYIVSKTGIYKFKTVKGNSSESVRNVASASILWETFGTDAAPEPLDLISGFCYKDGYISFQTSDTFKEGNAVIAAKDANGNIIWSWHIWLTDQPQGQEYYNSAGTMMDRNLGATSATPGDVGALGLLYQWGRKDPFLGSSSISSSSVAKSTITWPSAVSSNSNTGTITYATANPTTFITYNDSNYDWYYIVSYLTDNTRWKTSKSNKSIYDPCPAGWRVPDGGDNGVWSKACSSSDFDYTYNSTNEGMNFSGKFGADQTIWYPASGCRLGNDGSLYDVGYDGYYWSASPGSSNAYTLYFGSNGVVNPSFFGNRALGRSVRCLQE